MKDITKYTKGVVCINTSSNEKFTLSGNYAIDSMGIWDVESMHYIYMPKCEFLDKDYWAKIID